MKNKGRQLTALDRSGSQVLGFRVKGVGFGIGLGVQGLGFWV
jgi:hypothetical protein